MPIITLTSDYGHKDHRVPAIKGQILSLNPEINIVDITHHVAPYNLIETSYIVKNAYSHFPKGTVHIIGVDSFYTRDRKYILYKSDGHFFIAADNGVLSLIFFDIKPELIFEITINNRFDDKINFAVTDILVPAAVHLCNGGIPEVIGRPLTEPKELSFARPSTNGNKIVGEGMYIDHFGNVVTNISKKNFEKKMKNYNSFSITFRNLQLNKIYSSYTELVTSWEEETSFHGSPAAIFNNAGLLELTIYKGNRKNGAHSLFGLNIGDKVMIEFNSK